MKLRAWVWLLVLLALTGKLPESGSLAAIARAPQPAAYTSLAAWARANGFTTKISGETISLSKASANLVLKSRSREAKVNGVNVWLLSALSSQNGNVLISNRDLRLTLEPLLSTPKLRRGATIRTICLDPGHGGKDSGTRLGYRLEKHYALYLARELRDQLVAAGFKVVMTRTSDSFVELEDRPAFARRQGADLFLSLHYNSADDSVRGAEVYCLTPAGAISTNAQGQRADTDAVTGNRNDPLNLALAYQIQKALVRDLGVIDRGVHRSRFKVLSDATMPAALIEPGFLSHPLEGKKLFSDAYRRQIAKAVTRAVVAYKKAVEQRPA